MATEATYKKLISLEGAKNLIFFGALGRAPFSMLQVGMVIFGNYKTGSYAIGGAMAASFSISNALIPTSPMEEISEVLIINGIVPQEIANSTIPE